MNAIIATTLYTSSITSAPATFDAGRQPLATLQSNTPEQKRSIKGHKIADVFFCPTAVNPWANPAQSPVKVKDVPKPKKLVDVPKQTADVFFCSEVSYSASIIHTLNEVDDDDDDDDDVPITKLKEIALSSLAAGPSTLKRVPRVDKRAGPKDSCDPDDEDLPLSRVKELMEKLGRRPAPIQFVPGSPPPFKSIKHTLLRPATIRMKCIASNCPFDWHEHVNVANH